jgi:hypothetical protein
MVTRHEYRLLDIMIILIIIITGTTALTGASRREYGYIAEVSANEEQVARLPPQHTHSNHPDSTTRAIW